MQQFKPNELQLKLLETMLDTSVSSNITEICSVAGIDRSTYYRWMKDPSFVYWFSKAWKESVMPLEPLLDKIAINNASKDFRYYKLIQEKYFIKAKASPFLINVNSADRLLDAVDKLEALYANEE